MITAFTTKHLNVLRDIANGGISLGTRTRVAAEFRPVLADLVSLGYAKVHRSSIGEITERESYSITGTGSYVIRASMEQRAAHHANGRDDSRVVIMSGVPGSGKSTYARSIAASLDAQVKIVSADDFFTRDDGSYNSDPQCLFAAHAGCMRTYLNALPRLQSTRGVIVVDNTNTSAVEIAPYYMAATAYALDVEIVTVLCDPKLAAARNTHDVNPDLVNALDANLRARVIPPYWHVTLRTIEA
jgi:hypothetical protein